MSLSAIYIQLVKAAQAEYDLRVSRGINPLSFASYHFCETIDDELQKHINTRGWQKDNWQALIDAQPEIEGYENGRWAVSAVVGTWKAYSTPGFFEAYNNSIIANN